ncbi:MAG TPA: IS66 family transposase [Burkholderiaceae bacterium]|nr:IS66 family transposase [Burkholderiaceae bacterium]
MPWPRELDVGALRARLAEFETTIATFEGERAAWREQQEALQAEVKLLRVERDLYKERAQAIARQLFAAKSEQRGLHQRDLFFNEAEALAPPTTSVAKVRVPAHERAKRGRKPLDPALPREVIRYELPETERICPHDGSALKEIGVEASEQLDIVPAQVRVIRHERVKYACPCCSQGVRTAPAPLKLIPKALLTEAALAWVITAKYQDALPLYRQAALLNRFGGDIARNTLAHVVVQVGRAVQPIINLLRDYLLDADIVHGDETEVQVLKENGRPAQAKSYLWAQVSGTGPPVHLYTYAPSRSAKTAAELYAGARGALMSDGYEPYAKVADANRLVHLGCWAHARRYLIEAEAALPKEARSAEQPATRMLALISELYEVEARWRQREGAPDETPEQAFALRGQLRQEHSAPLIDRLQGLLLAHLHGVLPQSLLGKALHYLHEQWPKLVRFLDDGRYPIDNNLCENAIRPFVVGRKNWLFSDTVAGARASANLYSLIETAKANGVEPYRYLCQLFQALPAAKGVDEYEALLPWQLASAA